ncbi:hypothetical protein [Photobacterium kishitanii]|uniref:Uncharacterized protein n=1 Tax=Photobacterium kishitanii TaxID=318456 RepID=A0A2T3KL81_9GAMM|nr:hypothetical protein [Photobacterium kishitanii]PSV00478.1 hypothetical protein C9J27_04920 [Photobacterium kishitanii]
MFNLTYRELLSKSEKLDLEFSETENEIEKKQIAETIALASVLIHGYDLSDDDLFKCDHCHQVFDIEDSVKIDSKYVCEQCCKGD